MIKKCEEKNIDMIIVSKNIFFCSLSAEYYFALKFNFVLISNCAQPWLSEYWTFLIGAKFCLLGTEIWPSTTSHDCVQSSFLLVYNTYLWVPIKISHHHKTLSNSPSKDLEFTVIKCHKRNLTTSYNFNCYLEVIMSRGQNTVYFIIHQFLFFIWVLGLYKSIIFW